MIVSILQFAMNKLAINQAAENILKQESIAAAELQKAFQDELKTQKKQLDTEKKMLATKDVYLSKKEARLQKQEEVLNKTNTKDCTISISRKRRLNLNNARLILRRSMLSS
ncbi:hypothetical protein DYB32_010388 [Aphanomyces invadans]|uniref:Uncharacterized protein n=1 Tax=Aphanomyces invadans TaxID=157072 RepID=A0A418AG76_9STRA|nr:hypothetical protein DYB32_010388 [Aphanomyces invadans]